MQDIVKTRNAVFSDVTPCGSLRAEVSEECIASVIKVTRIGDLGTTLAARSEGIPIRLPVTAGVVPSASILVTLMTEAIRSSETPYLQELLGVTFKKTAFFIVTEMKTSNLIS
jgi:hypothetical protein